MARALGCGNLFRIGLRNFSIFFYATQKSFFLKLFFLHRKILITRGEKF